MRCLVFVLLVGATFATGDDKTVGGYERTPHSQPHQVSLNSSYHFCGAACRCVWASTTSRSTREQFNGSSRVIRHPRYSSYDIDNDIMLIKLSRPATLNQYVKPAALPSSCAPAGTMSKVSGWGNTMSSTADRNKLQCLDIPILSDKDCNNSYPGMIIDAMFCAEYRRTHARVTPGAPWCATASFRVLCLGVSAVPRRTTRESMPRSAFSTSGWRAPCRVIKPLPVTIASSSASYLNCNSFLPPTMSHDFTPDVQQLSIVLNKGSNIEFHTIGCIISQLHSITENSLKCSQKLILILSS
ncbi:trypsin-1-like [Syngnathus scovelli]|uniref:trypsin-1-like n=1 Tax=Syngnathus scovelli TaxID=161590 RepID=UPI00210F291E|nr:trypsin-1-like [Syngnathus scovelli]